MERGIDKSPSKGARKRNGKTFVDGCHQICLSENNAAVLRQVFENFSHINEATKVRLMRSQYIVEIFASILMPVTINDIDIANKTIKTNLNSNLTFDQFVAVLEHLVLEVVGLESFSEFIENDLGRF